MSRPTRSWLLPRHWWLVLALLLVAAALRIYAVEWHSLRGDDAFSVSFSAQPVAAILTATGNAEPNPPLYWFGLHGWMRVAGRSELAVRWPSVLAGLVAVALTYRLGAALAGGPVGRRAALLAAVNPFLIWYAQDARAYSLLAALVTAATWLTWSAAKRHIARHWLAAGVFWWLSLFTHYLAALPAAAVAGALLLAPATRGRWRAAGAMFAAVALAYLPWVVYVGSLLAGDRKAWLVPPSLGEALWRSLAAASAGTPSTGATAAATLLGVLLLGGLVAWGALWALRRRPSAAVWLMLAGLAPTLLLWAVSWLRPLYAEQYIFGSLPALLALGAVGAWRLTHVWPRARWLGAGALGLLLGVGLLAASNAAFNPVFAKSPDWRALNRYLTDTARPGEVVVVNLPDPAFYLYYTGAMPAVTSPPRALDAASLPDTDAQLSALRDRYLHIRFLPQPQSGYDPNGYVAEWLAACCEKTADEFVSGWRVQTFDTPAGSLQARRPQVAAFANGLTLTGYRFLNPELPAGDTLHLTLYWTTSAPVTQSYTVFVHLLAADGFNVAGADSLPAGGRRPTNTWTVDDVVIDAHLLPLDAGLPPGDYTLEVGLYLLETGERVSGPAGAAVQLLEPIHVTAPK